MNNTARLYQEAIELIPGGSCLYSKRPELYAQGWPAYYSKASGIQVTDLDGNKYLDFSTMGLGACILGYRDHSVDEQVLKVICNGTASSLNGPEEVELAKMLTTLHPWAQQVRYTRSGGEAIAVAIRIARTYTSRSNVYTYGSSYHGWHVNDPRTGTKFIPYISNEDRPAAILIEPSRLTEPMPGYLESMREKADDCGAILIFDEISCGFRRNLGGVHLQYGVTPDIAVFSKAMSNGYPMAAVIGTKKVMQAAENTFISSTAWSERIGPTAAVATIHKLWAEDVYGHIDYIGGLVKDTIRWHSKQAGLDVKVSGPNQMLHLEFPSAEIQTLYTQCMLERGFLAGRDFYPSYAHQLEHVEAFSQAVSESFVAIQDGAKLHGPVAGPGVRR